MGEASPSRQVSVRPSSGGWKGFRPEDGGQSRGRLHSRSVAVLLAGFLLVGGCAGEPDVETTGSPPSEPAAENAGENPTGLERCRDVAELTPSVEGSLGARQNPDPGVMDVLLAYGDEHPDTFGGMWIDRTHRVIVMAFTDDPEAHREAMMAREPPADGTSEVDPRPLDERDDAMIDVVQVRYSQAELEAMQRQIIEALSDHDLGESMLSYVSVTQNRLSLDLWDPAEGAFGELAASVPDPEAVCVSVSGTREPPGGPLDVIPDLNVEDPLVTCQGIPPVRYSQLVDPPSIDEIDHPAVEALRTELEDTGGEPMPEGRWKVIGIEDDLATFMALHPDNYGHAGFERSGDRWVLSGFGVTNRPCEAGVAFPEGLNRVEISLDPDSPPDPESSTIHLLATEVACASGREMGDALLDPQLVETDAAVLFAFAAIPLHQREVNCQGNPSTPVTVELSRPLGNRTIHDGSYVPPKPLDPAPLDE